VPIIIGGSALVWAVMCKNTRSYLRCLIKAEIIIIIRNKSKRKKIRRISRWSLGRCKLRTVAAGIYKLDSGTFAVGLLNLKMTLCEATSLRRLKGHSFIVREISIIIHAQEESRRKRSLTPRCVAPHSGACLLRCLRFVFALTHTSHSINVLCHASVMEILMDHNRW